ncbi:restriction endonuclease subunit S [Pseudanabaena yagii]|uniref:Restriction endonuclease subunit S n=1 Tax=Pseudanabaena yagii GIHE-NHR1 TaxID=2722753 RepID=A0ABX1LPB9_9CYAN|nr:restriction endonuclease subunit S [Pseudanabaena yagii]NMF56955.1 restriction endonuclease subunit S [Pseudanabaena yagii GIHE-NHR1]
MAFPKYESYKNSGVEWLGEIPSHWEAKRNLGLFDERKETNRPDMELLSVTIDQGVIRQSEISIKKDSSNEDKAKYKVVYRGDLAYNKMRMWQGAIGMSDFTGIVSPAYIILNTRNKNYAKFFHYLYRTELFIKEANRHSYGLCSDMNSLRYEDFKTLYSPVPPHDEVNRIVDFLDRTTTSIDQAIAKKQRLIELLNEQKAILINRAVTKGLNPNVPMRDSGIEWIGEIPEHWGVSRISFIGKIGNGSTPNRSNASYWNNGAIPWLNSSKVNDIIIKSAEQFVTPKAVRECHLPLVKPNSIVIAITGEGKTRGNSAICKIETTINQHLAYIEILDKDILPEFLHLYLQGMYELIRLSSSGNGSTKGAITCDDIKKYKIPVPPLEEQKNILNVTSNRIKDIEEVSQKTLEGIEKLNSLKQVFISEAVTGKIKV